MKMLIISGGIILLLAGWTFAYIKSAKKTIREMKEKNKATSESLDHVKKMAQIYTEGQKENEELHNKATGGNELSNFDAGLDLLRKQADRGRKRNS